MSVGLDGQIATLRTRVESLHAGVFSEIDNLRQEEGLAADFAGVEALNAITERTTELGTNFIEKLATLNKLDREGKFEEGKREIELSYMAQERELELLRKKIEILRETTSLPQIYDQPKPGLCIEGFCNSSSCTEYSKLVFLNKGFGTFMLGPECMNFCCPACSEPLQKVEKVCFIKDGPDGCLSVRVTDEGAMSSQFIRSLFYPLTHESMLYTRKSSQQFLGMKFLV